MVNGSATLTKFLHKYTKPRDSSRAVYISNLSICVYGNAPLYIYAQNAFCRAPWSSCFRPIICCVSRTFWSRTNSCAEMVYLVQVSAPLCSSTCSPLREYNNILAFQ